MPDDELIILGFGAGVKCVSEWGRGEHPRALKWDRKERPSVLVPLTHQRFKPSSTSFIFTVQVPPEMRMGISSVKV